MYKVRRYLINTLAPVNQNQKRTRKLNDPSDRLDLLDEHIKDFRAQIDCVLIDTDYKAEHFGIVESDVPEKDEDFIEGEYTVSLPRPDARVAVKIIDRLGEETIEIG